MSQDNAGSGVEARAVACIERCWRSYRDCQIFKVLKQAVQASENAIAQDILRQISPLEAQLLKDPCFSAKVKFRFAGSEFPPYVVFKIYLANKKSSYMTGKKTIKPASKAASDACCLMGNRIFLDQVMSDVLLEEHHSITEQFQVTNMREFMMLQKTTDELSPALGGKANNWRRLNLEGIGQHRVLSGVSCTRPITCQSSASDSHIGGRNPQTRSFQPSKPYHTLDAKPSRRRNKTHQRIAKMRKLYGLNTPENLPNRDEIDEIQLLNASDGVTEGDLSDLEDEASELYRWSQGLC